MKRCVCSPLRGVAGGRARSPRSSGSRARPNGEGTMRLQKALIRLPTRALARCQAKVNAPGACESPCRGDALQREDARPSSVPGLAAHSVTLVVVGGSQWRLPRAAGGGLRITARMARQWRPGRPQQERLQRACRCWSACAPCCPGSCSTTTPWRCSRCVPCRAQGGAGRTQRRPHRLRQAAPESLSCAAATTLCTLAGPGGGRLQAECRVCVGVRPRPRPALLAAGALPAGPRFVHACVRTC